MHSHLFADMANVPTFLQRTKLNLGEGASSQPSGSKRGAPGLDVPKQGDRPDPTLEDSRDPKKRRAVKKQQTLSSNSLSSRALGEIGASIASDEELRAWRAKSDSEKDEWILKASCEMLVHNMDRENAKTAQGARLSNLEKEVSSLKKDAKKNEKALQAAESAKKTAEEDLVKERARLEKEIADLKKENSKLESANKGLSEEISKVEGASFFEGVCSYVATFLSGDPNYEWLPKFGRTAADFMAKFPEEHPELLAAKKAELEATLAKEAAEETARQEGGNQGEDASAH